MKNNLLQQESKTFWYDNLRVIATIGVIFIHVSSDYVPMSGKVSLYNFWIGNIFDSASRFSVPIFVMLSGALLLPKEYGIGVFLKKRLFRLLLPFLFWSLVYISRSIYLRMQQGEKMSFFEIAREFFVQLRDGSSLHLWYIYMIVGLYLFIPIIGKWVRNATEKEILYFLAIWLCTLFLDQPFISKIKPEIELSYFTGFLGYLILGHYLRIKSFENVKRINLISVLMILIGLLSTIFGTYLMLYFKNEYASTFYECLTPNILLYAMGLFLLQKNKDTTNRIIVPIRNYICKYSYGIFLVHVLVLNLLDGFGITWDFINPIAGIPVTVFLCLAISSGIIFVVNKLPFGKYISG
jgi:surface polysaccharide O-acyltransferase-like enzyme